VDAAAQDILAGDEVRQYIARDVDVSQACSRRANAR